MLNKNEIVKIFKALGNETRYEIFHNLLIKELVSKKNNVSATDNTSTQTICVGDIANKFHFSLPAISRHLKEMKDANIITMTKVQNKIYIKPNTDILKDINSYFKKSISILR
jgi:ArsR family transcriptional regulator